MMNPYGVQRDYRLGLDELERRQGRQAGRLHEVGAERRRQGAAAARLDLMLAQATDNRPRRGLSGPPALGLVRRARRLALRLVRFPVRGTAA
jgi:hypothetical protein